MQQKQTRLYFIVTTVLLILILGIGLLHFFDHKNTATTIHLTISLILSFVAYVFLLWYARNTINKNYHETSQLSAKLSEEQSKSDILLKSIADGVIVIDLQFRIRLLNSAAEKITGWSEEEARGIDFHLVMPMFSNNDIALAGEQDPFTLSFQRKESTVNNDVVLQTKSGKRVTIMLSVAPIFGGPEGLVTGGIGIFRDISEQKATERQRSEFISTASHEMRTPLATIEGYLALALSSQVSEMDPKNKDYVLKAHNAVQQLGTLFKDLLSTSLIEEGRVPANKKVFDITGQINQAVEEMRLVAQHKGLKLSIRSSNEKDKTIMPLYYIEADPRHIREVLINLLNNAIKFTETGEVYVTITADIHNVIIGVHDTGIGISAEEIPHLFQKFYRLDNSQTRQVGGTGLGLYICRNLIELYNGRMWVQSTPKQGSSFYFSLPRVAYHKVRQQAASRELVEPITKTSDTVHK